MLVLMATYNGGRWIDQQLTSIFAQAGVDVSVLVSDHWSSDDTVARLDAWRASGAAITRIEGPPSGGGAARNFLHLLRSARFEEFDGIALADQDDIWAPDRLRRALQVLDATGAAGYSSDVLAFWPDGRRARLGKAHAQRRLDYLMEPAGPGCTYVLTPRLAASVQQEVSRQPERFEATSYHDWLIYVYARTHGHAWIIDDQVGVQYRQHSDNDVGANVGLAGIVRRWRRVQSGVYRNQAIFMGRLWPGPHASALARLERFALRDRLWLAGSVLALRRRPRDQLALFSMLLLGTLR